MTDVPGAETFRVAAEAYDRHVGCRPGALTAALADLLGADRVAAVDPSEPFAQACGSRVPGV